LIMAAKILQKFDFERFFKKMLGFFYKKAYIEK
jgi:hypothetical protein